MKVKYIVLFIFFCLSITACNQRKIEQNEYSVLLGEDASDIENFPMTEIMVIDGEYFTAEDLTYLRKKGVKKIYSYLNIGSVEEFRTYYDEYSDETLGDYENWPEEHWVDVSSEKWQSFITERADVLVQKGFDGFFIDNADVYYRYQMDDIYNGIVQILKNLKVFHKDIIINGGDTFVTRYLESDERNNQLFNGVNQENVYTSYDFSKELMGKNTSEERAYFEAYLEMVSKRNIKVYVLEYAKSGRVIRDAQINAQNHGWTCYVADNIQLKCNQSL